MKLTKKTPVSNKREELKAFLAQRLPTMFDRDPVITGNLDLLVDDILNGDFTSDK